MNDILLFWTDYECYEKNPDDSMYPDLLCLSRYKELSVLYRIQACESL